MFHVTGFGKFHAVARNPTEQIVATLRQALPQDGHGGASAARDNIVRATLDVRIASLVSARVLETSAECVAQDVRRAYRDALASARDDARQAGERAGAAAAPPPAAVVVVCFLHLGVDVSASRFKLETQARNDASFSRPDERGWQPRAALVSSEESAGRVRRCDASMDVEALCARLLSSVPGRRGVNAMTDGAMVAAAAAAATEGEEWIAVVPSARRDDAPRDRRRWWDVGVALSKDAGTFVCNYVYYRSLKLCEEYNRERREAQDDARAAAKDERIESVRTQSLFVHVPPAARVAVSEQVMFVVQLMNAIASANDDDGKDEDEEDGGEESVEGDAQLPAMAEQRSA